MLDEIEREFEGIIISIEIKLNMKNVMLRMCLLAAATRDLKQLNDFTEDDEQCKYLCFLFSLLRYCETYLSFILLLSQLQRETV